MLQNDNQTLLHYIRESIIKIDSDAQSRESSFDHTQPHHSLKHRIDGRSQNAAFKKKRQGTHG